MVQVACFSPRQPVRAPAPDGSRHVGDLGAASGSRRILWDGFPPGGDCDWGVFRSSSQEDVDSYLVEHYHYLPLPEYSAASSVQTTRSSRPRRFIPN